MTFSGDFHLLSSLLGRKEISRLKSRPSPRAWKWRIFIYGCLRWRKWTKIFYWCVFFSTNTKASFPITYFFLHFFGRHTHTHIYKSEMQKTKCPVAFGICLYPLPSLPSTWGSYHNYVTRVTGVGGESRKLLHFIKKNKRKVGLIRREVKKSHVTRYKIMVWSPRTDETLPKILTRDYSVPKCASVFIYLFIFF